MKPKAQERGQALVIIALAIVGLFGFSALAIDGSRVFSDRRHAQNAADTSALSAALARIRGEPFEAAAKDRASSNGYADDANSKVIVNLCNDLKGTDQECPGIPVLPNPPPTDKDELARADHENYVRVKIESTIPATFGRIVGRKEFTNIVTAVAYAGPVELVPAANGAALAALKEEGDKTLYGNGRALLTVKGSGVFNNSRNKCGTFVAGAGSVYTIENPHQFQFAAGDYCIGAGIPPGTLKPVVEVPQIPYPPPFNIPTPTITCSGNGSSGVDPVTGAMVFTPGNFPSGANVSYAGGVLFEPGNYCFGDNFSLKGSTQAIANNVKIRMDRGEFSLDGISSLTCSNLLVHIDGGSGIKFAGNSTIACNDVTFFATTGGVTWEGNAVMKLFAPQGGDYKNLLIYLPYPNGQNGEEVNFAGTSDSELHGSIIAVHANIKFAGVTGTEGFQSQIIGYTVELFGSTNTLIDYDPDENWKEPDPSAVTLTK